MFILDASVIIAFYKEIGLPEVLHRLKDHSHSLIVPSRVLGEIRGEAFVILKSAIDNGIIEICNRTVSSECDGLKFKYPTLSNGEIEVIMLGMLLKSKSKTYYCVLDDKAARKVASSLGLNIIGTKGLLNHLKELGSITEDEKQDLLSVLDSSSFRG